MSWLSKLTSTLRPNRLQDDLDDELRFHIERRADELIAQGMPPDQAHREAARRFGNQTLLKESTRDRDVLVWLETALQDIRYALRTLRRSPGFAATAILSLALGIGANVALFSLTDAMLLRPLPVRDPQSLVHLQAHTQAFGDTTFTFGLYDSIRKNARTLTGAAAMALGGPTIEMESGSAPAHAEIVSGNYFDVLGVEASRGRVFRDAEQPVAVISETFARSQFSGKDPIGAHLKSGKVIYTIVGVADPRFRGATLDWPADVWIPLEQAVPANSPRRGANWNWLEVIARLAPGATSTQAKAELEALQQRFLEQVSTTRHFDHPQQRAAFFNENILLRPGATGISWLRKRYTQPLMILVAVAGIVLLIACVNLANLMLARATAREREIATRRAIGAGRARLVRQLLTESAVVVIAGAAGAALIARWLSDTLLAFLSAGGNVVSNLNFRVDLRLAAFMIAISVVTCLLAGLAPAIRASGPPRSQSSAGGRALIVVEVALCTILLIGSAWFVRTLRNLQTLDAGFVRDQVLMAVVSAPPGAAAPEAIRRIEELRSRLASLPGARSVAYSNMTLMTGDEIANDIEVEGRPLGKDEKLTSTQLRISPGFFKTLDTPLLAGRDFTDADQAGAPKVAMVNRAFARRFFGVDNPAGRRFGTDGPKSAWEIEIVGVVKDTKYASLRDEPRPIFYTPVRQDQADTSVDFVIRSAGDMRALSTAVRDIVHEFDPKVTGITRFSDLVDMSLSSERMVAQLSAGFGGLALLVACIGIYGILAYRVARRTREIGVRIALGASRGGVQWMIVRESLALLIIGIAIGIPVALGLSRYVKSLLFGLTPADPWTMAGALAMLALVSCAAAFLPARRAAKIDPMAALRCD
jgi:predicted permease